MTSLKELGTGKVQQLGLQRHLLTGTATSAPHLRGRSQDVSQPFKGGGGGKH